MADTKFGVELEFLCPKKFSWEEFAGVVKFFGLKNKLDVEVDCYNSNQNFWNVMCDGSVNASNQEGMEISSPILKGKKGLAEVKKMCNMLTELGCTVNNTCGLHVHVDAQKFKPQQKIAVVARYAHMQDQIDMFVASHRRGNNNYNCQKIYLHDMEEAFIQDGHVDTYIFSPHNLKLDISSNHPTLEFRGHQGTLDADKVLNWIEFCVNFTNESVKTYRKFSRKKDQLHVMLNDMKDTNPLRGMTYYKRNKFLSIAA